ncbi:helix-turn-helix transcriptional regulator [Micromonospora echinofusca]|uniref:AAA family ATPase n=1 Tax=Micromonospora echinofusca TaxID=47858 RepID=A0ABS3VWL4_MICEH|nr:LuxR family transcriptional regulator [Micromonospora echinofusca]MBO4208925.1 AAA family ATPase [Micromonospora echinofusca]
MRLVERDEAVSSLNELLSAVIAGRGRVAMVTGAVATGRSELLSAFVDQAVDQGAVAVTAAGARTERDLPFGVLSQLVHDAPLRAEDRTRAMELLAEGIRGATRTGQPDGGQIDIQTVHALCTVLLDLAEESPLVLVVDDLHHADHASVVCLSYLARRVRGARVLMLLSRAEYGQPGEPLMRDELLRPGYSSTIRLAPLTAVGVRRAAEPVVGQAAAGRFAAEWYALSGGNPRLLGALLEDHQQAAGADTDQAAEVTVGDRYAQAVVACLHRGGPHVLRVARGVAVLGESDSLNRLLDVDTESAVRTVRALAAAGVLTPGGFRHPAARSAVLAELDTDERTALHSRAAVLAYDRGAAPCTVAEHLVRAGHVNEPWGIAVLEDAARQALREGRVPSAVECLKLAWRSCADEQRQARIMTTLVRAEWRINPSLAAGHLPQLVDAMRRGLLRGGDTVVLAKVLLWHGRFAEARDVLEKLNDTGIGLDPDTVAELAITRPWLRCSYPPFLTHLRQAPAAVTTVAASRRLEAASALATVLTKGLTGDLATEVERILRGSRLDEMTLDTVESALLSLVYGGQAERAAPWCDLFVEEAQNRRAPSRQARLLAVRSEIAMRLGDLPGADRSARAALRLMPPSSWGVAVGLPLANLMLAATAMGRFDDVREQLDQPVPEAMFQTRYGLHYLHARGRYSLAAGHLPLALRDFQLCGKLMGGWELDVPGLVPWRTEAAEVYLRMGRPDEARRLVEDQLGRCGKEMARVHGITLRQLASVSHVRHRPMLLRQAADLLQAGGDRYEMARALVDLTEAYYALGESRRAGTIGRRGRALAEECQAQRLIRVLSRNAAWDDGPNPVQQQPAPGGVTALLSDAERRVAALAAVGYTNREISEKLYITISTVEQHLTRTYRKLNVTRRSELPADLELDFSGAS